MVISLYTCIDIRMYASWARSFAGFWFWQPHDRCYRHFTLQGLRCDGRPGQISVFGCVRNTSFERQGYEWCDGIEGSGFPKGRRRGVTHKTDRATYNWQSVLRAWSLCLACEHVRTRGRGVYSMYRMYLHLLLIRRTNKSCSVEFAKRIPYT